MRKFIAEEETSQAFVAIGRTKEDREKAKYEKERRDIIHFLMETADAHVDDGIDAKDPDLLRRAKAYAHAATDLAIHLKSTHLAVRAAGKLRRVQIVLSKAQYGVWTRR